MDFTEEERLAAERLLSQPPIGAELQIRGNIFVLRDALAAELFVFRLVGRNEVIRAEPAKETKK